MTIISLKKVGYQTPAGNVLLHDIDLKIAKGELVVLSGPSGSGKSTLLNVLNGLHPELYEGQVTGTGSIGISSFPIQDFTEHVATLGMVFQNPKTHFFTTDVASELAFVMENYGYDPARIRRQVAQQLTTYQLTALEDASMFHLSGGQRQLVSIAAANMLPHDLLLLDEPSSNLDHQAIQQLKRTLIQLKQQGKTIIVAEHRLSYLMDCADRLLVLNQGTIIEDDSTDQIREITEQRRKQLGLRSFTPIAIQLSTSVIKREPTITMTIDHLRYRYRKQSTLALEISQMKVDNTNINGLIGDNGAGKSTLFQIISGLKKAKQGAIAINGRKYKPKQLLDKTFFVMQDVNLQLFFETVEKELLEKAQKPERFEEICDKFQLTPLLQRHPHSLSGGEKQRVAIASALLSGKEILLFDEPTSGLDYRHMQEVSGLFKTLLAEPVLVLVISHDEEFLQATCQTIFSLVDGKLQEIDQLEE